MDALAAHGCNPRQRGQSWTARCPAHEDTNPSLSVSDSPTGTGNTLVYCHAGCTTAEVAHALGLRMVDLFPPRPAPEVIPMGGIKAAYSYYDTDGVLTYQVLRKWPKSFIQRRPDGNGGWIKNVEGVDKIPYLLPQVLRAKEQGKAIWVCEGEKDAENAQWYGVVGTCNSGGAGKWNEHCTAALVGAAKVIVVADKDEVGHSHARKVAEALRGKVKRLIVVEPGRGKDLSEHQEVGGTAAQMTVLWDSNNPTDWLGAGPIEVTAEPDPLDSLVIHWPTFFSVDRAEEAWLAYPLIPEGRQVALFAPAKTGKSLVALDVAASVATGRPILGQTVVPRRHTLYLDYEMTEADLQERMFDLGYGLEHADELAWFHYALLPALPPLDTLDGAKACCQLAEHYEADLVVIDTLGRAVQGDENDNDTVRAFYRHTGLALKASGRSVLRTDHAGKDIEKGQRGASAKNDDVDVVWRMVRMEDGLMLRRTHSRVPWVPEQIHLNIHEDPLRHIITNDGYPAGTKDCADDLDTLGVLSDAGRNAAMRALKDAGKGRRPNIVSAAQRYRRSLWITPAQPVDNPREPPREPLPKGVSGNYPGNHPPESASDQQGTTLGTTGNHLPSLMGTVSPPLGGNQYPGQIPDDNPIDPGAIF